MCKAGDEVEVDGNYDAILKNSNISDAAKTEMVEYFMDNLEQDISDILDQIEL